MSKAKSVTAGRQRRVATLLAVILLILSVGACARGGGQDRAHLRSSPTTPQAPASAVADGLGHSPPSGPRAKTGVVIASLPHFKHVVVVLENHRGYPGVALSPRAPYLTSLAAAGVRMTNSYAVGRRRESNYLALFSGSTPGPAAKPCPPQSTGRSLASELRSAGDSFSVYAEPRPTGNHTGCAKTTCAQQPPPQADFGPSATINKPFSTFPRDFTKLPTVAFVIPGLNHDMDKGSITEGDAWLAKNLAGYARWSARHDSLLIVTFLAGDNPHSNHILTVLSGANLLPGTDSSRVTHYSILRTIENVYKLHALGGSAAASPITADWQV